MSWIRQSKKTEVRVLRGRDLHWRLVVEGIIFWEWAFHRARWLLLHKSNQPILNSWIKEKIKNIKTIFNTTSRNNWQAIETVSDGPTLKINNPSVWLQRKQRKKILISSSFPNKTRNENPSSKKTKGCLRLTWVQYILYWGYDERTGMKASISFIFYTFSRETNST